MQRQSVCQISAWKRPKHTLQVTFGETTLEVTLRFLLAKEKAKAKAMAMAREKEGLTLAHANPN